MGFGNTPVGLKIYFHPSVRDYEMGAFIKK